MVIPEEYNAAHGITPPTLQPVTRSNVFFEERISIAAYKFNGAITK
jgi:hypothetical protein